MNQLQTQILSGEYHEPAKTIYKDDLLSWLNDTYRYEVQLSSFEVAETIVRVHLIPYFKEMPLDKITAYDIDQLYTHKLNDGMAPATVPKIHNVISKSLQKAVKWRLIKNNPAKDATPPSVHKKPKQIWTVEEAKAFLEVCEQEDELVPFLLAIFTGMRRGEILALRWKNVDLEKGRYSCGRIVNPDKIKRFVHQGCENRSFKPRCISISKCSGRFKEIQTRTNRK